MAQLFRILGQAAPGAANVVLYSVPAQTQTVISVLNIANTTAGALTCRVYATENGAAATTTNTLAYGLSVAANAVDATIKSITLRGGDSIIVYGSAAGLTFSLFGSEIS